MLPSLRFFLGMKPEEQAEAFTVLFLNERKIASEETIKNYCLHGFRIDAKAELLKLMSEKIEIKDGSYRLTRPGHVFARELIRRYTYFLAGDTIEPSDLKRPEQKKTSGRGGQKKVA
jgi:hypothetical protein